MNREFDAIAIDEFFTQVWALTESLDEWIFYQKVGPDMGISATGLDTLFRYYRQLDERGCRCIAVESNNLYADIAIHRWPSDLNMPIKISSQKEELESFIQQYLPEKP